MDDVTSTTEVVEDSFGRYQKIINGREVIEPIRRFTLTNGGKMKVQVITYGATITSILTPDKYGNIADVVMGFDNIEGYYGENPYFGATIGRFANRIADGKFVLGETEYTLPVNNPPSHLHGGIRGFDKVVWNSHVEGDRVTLSYLSPDGEEGYPGELLSHVSYELNNDNELMISYRATSTKPTPVNLTNHSYFNLAGHNAGREAIYQHDIVLNANKYIPVNPVLIPTGTLDDVGGTPYDLRISRNIGEALTQHPQGGYDDSFVINRHPLEGRSFVARVCHKPSGRIMEVYSTQPCVQFYTSNFLPPNDVPGIKGKQGAGYSKHGAFCLEPGWFIDAMNQAEFPQSILPPGAVYEQTITYKFFSKNEQ